MMKTMMVIGSLAVAAPVLAQEAQTVPSSPAVTAPATGQAAPAGDPMTAPPPQTTAAAPEATAARPATGATQIAQVVSAEFPTYDRNADAKLDKAEFGAWMVALKTASDPSTKAGDPATTKWVSGAFASADADRSKAVSQAELTSYLSQNAG